MAPTALRGRRAIMVSSASRSGTMRSMPTKTICTLGNESTMRPLPSLVTSVTDPVSATAKLHPRMPTSASMNSWRRILRRKCVISSGTSVPS